MHLVLLFLLLFTFAQAKHCTFIPPSGWEIAQLKNPSPHVKIGFIGKSSGEFRPSINLASEDVDVPLKDYLKAVKNLQSADPTTKWRDLGKFSMQGGIGRLTEMSSTSAWGELKILQAIFVGDQKAHILTAALLKEDFPKFQNELLKSFQSLCLIDDVWSPISDPEEQARFKALFSSLGNSAEKERELDLLQKQVGAKAELGPYWQFLALQEGRSRIEKMPVK